MNYRLTDPAKSELFDAAAYYDLERTGLGVEFAVQVGLGLAKILEAPRCWPEVDSGFRYRIDPFPFALIYREVSSDKIEIVSVFDLRRRPESWKRNLT